MRDNERPQADQLHHRAGRRPGPAANLRQFLRDLPHAVRLHAHLLRGPAALRAATSRPPRPSTSSSAPVRAKIVVPLQVVPNLIAALQEHMRVFSESTGGSWEKVPFTRTVWGASPGPGSAPARLSARAFEAWANIFPARDVFSYRRMATDAHAVVVPAAMDGSDDDPAARVAALFDAHYKRLFRLARRLVRHPDDPADVVQETFLRAARAPHRVPPGAASEEAWLVRVLINVCKDSWRHAAVRVKAVAAGHVRAAAGVQSGAGAARPLDGLAGARPVAATPAGGAGALRARRHAHSGDRTAARRHARHRSLASDARAPRDGRHARRRAMTHWKDRLLEADRALAREMSPGEVQRLRRTVVAEAASAARSRRRWSLPFVLTAGSLTAAVGGPGAVHDHGAAGRDGTSGRRVWRLPARSRRRRRRTAAAVSSFNLQHPAARGSSGSSMPNSR